MKISNANMQKKITISYNSLDELIDREPHMTNTLEGYLKRTNNEQYIQDTEIVVSENKFNLIFKLELTK